MDPSPNHPSMRPYVRHGVAVFDWTYRPVGPYTVQFFPEDQTYGAPIVESVEALEPAIRRFFEIGLPARFGWYGNIVDAADRLILCWFMNTDTVKKEGPDGLWHGVGEVFQIMIHKEIPNFVDPQIWAEQAMSNEW